MRVPGAPAASQAPPQKTPAASCPGLAPCPSSLPLVTPNQLPTPKHTLNPTECFASQMHTPRAPHPQPFSPVIPQPSIPHSSYTFASQPTPYIPATYCTNHARPLLTAAQAPQPMTQAAQALALCHPPGFTINIHYAGSELATYHWIPTSQTQPQAT
jgi:hypothetical protein